MESAIVSLISMTIILVGTLTMAQATLSSVDATSESWLQAEERMGELRRTNLTVVASSTPPVGALFDITVENQGEVALNDFSRWDVVIQYTGSDNSYYIKRLPYTGGALGDDQWTVTGIFLDAQTSDPEIFDPGILNPGEEAVLQIKLNPGVKSGSTNLISVVTHNGIVAQIIFTG